jgi:hypothetical protein
MKEKFKSKTDFFKGREKESETGLSLLSAFLFSFEKLSSPKRQKAGKENDDKK